MTTRRISPLDVNEAANGGDGAVAADPHELRDQEGHEEQGANEQANVEDHENAEGEVHEAPPPPEPDVRPLRDPGQPTERERRQHELTHLPFRPWCADCVAGAAAANPHRRHGPRADDEGLVKISVDYGFMSTGDDENESRTLLVMHASRSKAVMARVVAGKGRQDPSAVAWIIEQVRRLGVGRCVLQADGEPAQRTFIKEVVDEACRTNAAVWPSSARRSWPCARGR